MYKSLEHIIREIKEGKCSSEKKDSLEGAIRKVVRKESSYAARDSKPVEEDIGGLAGSGTGGEQKLHAESGKKKVKEQEVEDPKLPRDYGESVEQIDEIGFIGTDKFQGRQFQTRPPIIAPPVTGSGERGHGQAAKNVTVQRFRKLDKRSLTMQGKVSEELVTEAPIKFKEPTKTEFKIAPVAKEPKLPTVTQPKLPTTSKEVEDLATKATELAITATPMGRLASIAKQILKPTPAGEKVSEFERQKQLGIQPKLPEVKPATKVEVPTKAPEVKPETKPVEEPKAAPKAPPVPPAPGSKMPAPPTTPAGKIKFPGLPYATAKPVELTGPHAPVYTSVSKHRGHRAVKNVYKEETEQRKLIQDMPRKDAGDRHSIQYVGRKDADPKSTAEKTSRQAQYKIKVIDEAKKLAGIVKKVRKESGGQTKVYDNVVINPDLNRVDNRNDAELKP